MGETVLEHAGRLWTYLSRARARGPYDAVVVCCSYDLRVRRVTFVTKPNSVLRVALTVPIQWPEVDAFVDSPPFSFPHDVSNVIGVFGVIHEMVGDVDRIVRYPARGFQIAHELPPRILESFRHLVEEGFDRHLLG
jgi:hypothetical protein